MYIVSIFMILHGFHRSEANTEKQLYRRLLAEYNADIRPEPAHGHPVDVHFDLSVKKLLTIDVKTQRFVVTANNVLRWRDPQLVWKPTDFGNTQYISVSNTAIWTPDIVLFNSANDESVSHSDYYKTKVTIHPNGLVRWAAPVTWQVACSFDVTWFPVDKQVCNLTFGSWSHPSSQIRLVHWKEHSLESLVEKNLIQNGEWRFVDLQVHYVNLSFSCCRAPFSTVVFEFSLSRLSIYYFMYIFLPFLSLGFMFLLVFFIPYRSGERMVFGVTILLSITVYLLILSDRLPAKSDNSSMLGLSFMIGFYMLCGALVISLITTNLSRRKMPPSKNYVKIHKFLHNKSNCTVCNPDNINTDVHESTNMERGTHASVSYPPMEWFIIATHIDQCSFVVLMILLIIVPIVINLSLNTKGLGL